MFETQCIQLHLVFGQKSRQGLKSICGLVAHVHLNKVFIICIHTYMQCVYNHCCNYIALLSSVYFVFKLVCINFHIVFLLIFEQALKESNISAWKTILQNLTTSSTPFGRCKDLNNFLEIKFTQHVCYIYIFV